MRRDFLDNLTIKTSKLLKCILKTFSKHFFFQKHDVSMLA